MAKKGDKKGYNAKTNTGWIYDGTHWVHYKGGKPTGDKEKHGFTTTAVRGLGIGTAAKKLFGKKDKPNANKLKNNTTKSTSKSNSKTLVSDHAKTGHTKLVKGSDGKVRRVKVSDPTKDKTIKGSDTSKMKSKPSVKSTIHTRHYKTGKALGVMTRSQRRAYDKEAAGRTFESEVAKHEKSSGHGKAHLRETLYKKSLRKRNKNKGRVTREKDTGPTKLIKGVDGKVRRIRTKNQTSSVDTTPPKKKNKIKVSNEENTGPTKLVKGEDGKVRRVKA